MSTKQSSQLTPEQIAAVVEKFELVWQTRGGTATPRERRVLIAQTLQSSRYTAETANAALQNIMTGTFPATVFARGLDIALFQPETITLPLSELHRKVQRAWQDGRQDGYTARNNDDAVIDVDVQKTLAEMAKNNAGLAEDNMELRTKIHRLEKTITAKERIIENLKSQMENDILS
jgi:hypothetical protein